MMFPLPLFFIFAPLLRIMHHSLYVLSLSSCFYFLHPSQITRSHHHLHLIQLCRAISNPIVTSQKFQKGRKMLYFIKKNIMYTSKMNIKSAYHKKTNTKCLVVTDMRPKLCVSLYGTHS